MSGIENVAKAMEARRAEMINQPLARIWAELARAAIMALREPTQEMIDSAPIDIPTESQIVETWVAMIDAILSESC